MSRFESEPYPSGLLEPHVLEDNVLHDGVDVAVSPLDGAVNIQRGCAGRFVHGRHHGPRGVHDAASGTNFPASERTDLFFPPGLEILSRDFADLGRLQRHLGAALGVFEKDRAAVRAVIIGGVIDSSACLIGDPVISRAAGGEQKQETNPQIPDCSKFHGGTFPSQ